MADTRSDGGGRARQPVIPAAIIPAAIIPAAIIPAAIIPAAIIPAAKKERGRSGRERIGPGEASMNRSRVLIRSIVIIALIDAILLGFLTIQRRALPAASPGRALSDVQAQDLIARAVQVTANTSAESEFYKSGWLTDVDQALATARKLQRPVFMFCAVGDVSSGRC
jgi:hypothetical protein